MNHLDVLDFWFKELEPKQWWVKDVDLDETIRSRFHNLHKQAAACEFSHWRETAKGRLAEVIILDQFSRNLYRDTPSAFAYDALALGLAQEAIRTGNDQVLEPVERSFLYMPFMHSESLTIHEQAVELFTNNGIESNLDFEIKHKVIIERFGRYPHRNEILGRTSTKEEIEFLKQPDSSF